MLQPPGTKGTDARVDVSFDPRYRPIRKLVETAINHLLSSPLALSVAVNILLNTYLYNPSAKAEFKAAFGPNALPSVELLASYLQNSPPAIVIAQLKHANDDRIVWGLVTKGSSDAALRNELFISLELTDAIISVRDPLVRLNPHILHPAHDLIGYTIV
jgi:hypothetical protein